MFSYSGIAGHPLPKHAILFPATAALVAIDLLVPADRILAKSSRILALSVAKSSRNVFEDVKVKGSHLCPKKWLASGSIAAFMVFVPLLQENMSKLEYDDEDADDEDGEPLDWSFFSEPCFYKKIALRWCKTAFLSLVQQFIEHDLIKTKLSRRLAGKLLKDPAKSSLRKLERYSSNWVAGYKMVSSNFYSVLPYNFVYLMFDIGTIIRSVYCNSEDALQQGASKGTVSDHRIACLRIRNLFIQYGCAITVSNIGCGLGTCLYPGVGSVAGSVIGNALGDGLGDLLHGAN
jgi:hypothetical protein